MFNSVILDAGVDYVLCIPRKRHITIRLYHEYHEQEEYEQFILSEIFKQIFHSDVLL